MGIFGSVSFSIRVWVEMDLSQEIKNFELIAQSLIPQAGETPQLRGIDIYGESVPLNGVIGGDHIIYIDFKTRYDLDRRIREAKSDLIKQKLIENKTRAGIMLADVAGHQSTDATIHIGFHHAFLTGLLYELDNNGEVTTRLFEVMNTRFFKTANFTKYITMIYGEIKESGDFTFLSAGHPPPIIYSREFDRFVDIEPDRLITFYPIGLFPSEDNPDRGKVGPDYLAKKKYTLNHIKLLSPGDILLLLTDGLQDHAVGEIFYFPDRLEAMLKQTKDLSAREIFQHVKQDMQKFAPQEDDISMIVVKRE
jgi:serine phosphatase RsbU (regulator of sigma subunit)